MRVYIADDNEEFSLLLRRIAEGEGCLVTTCLNGEELFAEVSSESGPALLIVDINMPKLDGIEVIRKLAAVARRMRVRFITGGPDSSAIAARMIAAANGIDAGRFIMKPISVDDFKEVLRNEARLLLE